MNQLQDQVLNQANQAAQYLGPLNQGLNLINPVQYDQNPQQHPQNLGQGVPDINQKNAESNYFSY